MARPQKIVWLTGAAGFSGRHLLRYLRALPEPLCLVGLDLRPYAPEGLDAYHQVDLTDGATLREVARIQPPDRVIHLAGLLPPAAEPDLWRVNVAGTLNLLHAIAGANNPRLRVVTIGSAAEYVDFSARGIRENHPAGGNSPYGRAKWAQSVLSLAFGKQTGMHVIVARTFNLIGPGTPHTLVPGGLCAQFANGQREINVGNLKPKRDFIDIRDAVAGYWTICEKGKAGAIYNVCTGKAVSIGKLVDLFCQCAGDERIVRPDASRSRKNDLARVCGNNTKLLRLGFSPRISLRQSVNDMLKHARPQ